MTNLCKTGIDIYVETYACRSTDGITSSFNRNTSLVRTAVGRWTVTLTPPHPDGTDYVICATTEEQSGNRDTPDVTAVQGTITANGFDLQITTGDNGGTADVYVDSPLMVSVCAPITVEVF
jgi:hypothetical protein